MSPTPTTPQPYEYEVTNEADLVARLRQSPNALTTYLSAYGVFAAGITRGELAHLERALDYTNFLDESFGLGDFPDVALLDMAVFPRRFVCRLHAPPPTRRAAHDGIAQRRRAGSVSGGRYRRVRAVGWRSAGVDGEVDQ